MIPQLGLSWPFFRDFSEKEDYRASPKTASNAGKSEKQEESKMSDKHANTGSTFDIWGDGAPDLGSAAMPDPFAASVSVPATAGNVPQTNPTAAAMPQPVPFGTTIAHISKHHELYRAIANNLSPDIY